MNKTHCSRNNSTLVVISKQETISYYKTLCFKTTDQKLKKKAKTHSTVKISNSTLEGSSEHGFEGSYAEYECGVGFNTFWCGMLITFQVVTSNDWHQIMMGAQIDAGDAWWRNCYFLLLCVFTYFFV